MTTSESLLFYVFDFLALGDKMVGERVRESGPERLGRMLGATLGLENQEHRYAKTFKPILADTLFCFVLLRLCFTRETLRFPNIIQSYQKQSFRLLLNISGVARVLLISS